MGRSIPKGVASSPHIDGVSGFVGGFQILARSELSAPAMAKLVETSRVV